MSKTRKYLSSYPALVREWHPTRNGKQTPKDVTSGSGQTVWWKCLKKGHEWEAPINRRTGGGGTGCLECWREEAPRNPKTGQWASSKKR